MFTMMRGSKPECVLEHGVGPQRNKEDQNNFRMTRRHEIEEAEEC